MPQSTGNETPTVTPAVTPPIPPVLGTNVQDASKARRKSKRSKKKSTLSKGKTWTSKEQRDLLEKAKVQLIHAELKGGRRDIQGFVRGFMAKVWLPRFCPGHGVGLVTPDELKYSLESPDNLREATEEYTDVRSSYPQRAQGWFEHRCIQKVTKWFNNHLSDDKKQASAATRAMIKKLLTTPTATRTLSKAQMFSRTWYETEIKPVFEEQWAALKPTLDTTDPNALKGHEIKLWMEITRELYGELDEESQAIIERLVKQDRAQKQAAAQRASTEAPTDEVMQLCV
jgi:hypothetical protein